VLQVCVVKNLAHARRILAMNTLAFTVCFACWMLYGALITYLTDTQVVAFSQGEIGWLIGTPVLTGALMRLPMGLLTDRFGGRQVFTALMATTSVPLYLVGECDTFSEFFLAGLGFGCCGASFSVGVAYTSTFFAKQNQGTALGIFGVGNTGAALSSIGAPSLLQSLTVQDPEGWRMLPRLYAGMLLVTAVVFYFSTIEHHIASPRRSLLDRLQPLRYVRVWRFGAYYLLVFGGFVALAQWLIPYYVNVYSMSVTSAGFMAALFSFPSGVIRAFGGWLSDRFGARPVMYWVLGTCIVGATLLMVPRMESYSPGSGVQARAAGVVTEVERNVITVGDTRYEIRAKDHEWLEAQRARAFIPFPTSMSWHEPVVQVGETVERKGLLAQGMTLIYFQANVWIFTTIVGVVALAMGIGTAAVFKHIPDYFPNEVGTVGGMVGVLGGLGGFICPMLFGSMLGATGLWTSCWLIIGVIACGCLLWMHVVIRTRR